MFGLLPLAHAATTACTQDSSSILGKIKSEIVLPLIGLLFVVAFVYFLWGVVQYVINLNAPAARQDGQRHMLWGIVGLAIMLSAFGIMNFVFNTVTDNGAVKGIGGQDIQKPCVVQNNSF